VAKKVKSNKKKEVSVPKSDHTSKVIEESFARSHKSGGSAGHGFMEGKASVRSHRSHGGMSARSGGSRLGTMSR